jgi:hypothetical protein
MRRALLTLALLLAPAIAAADDASRIRSGHLDFFQGPVVSSGRAVGLGGAFVGIAEGAEAHLDNPASFATRPHHAANGWFDWDIGLSWFNVVGDSADLDMSGARGNAAGVTLLQGGFNLKFGRFGVGVHVMTHDYTLNALGGTSAADSLHYKSTFGGIGLGYAFLDGELTLGWVLSTGNASLGYEGKPEQVRMQAATNSGSWGLLWAPHGRPFRIGLATRPRVVMTQQDAGTTAPLESLGSLTLPASVVLPWSVSIGASHSFGARPYNIRPAYGVRPLPVGAVDLARLPRSYVLVSAELVLTGPVAGGLGVQPWLGGAAMTSGASASVGARAGCEAEIIDNRLVVRAGTYFEPARFDGRIGRMHATAGIDVRLHVFADFRVGALADVADGYSNLALGAGLWH